MGHKNRQIGSHLVHQPIGIKTRSKLLDIQGNIRKAGICIRFERTGSKSRIVETANSE